LSITEIEPPKQPDLRSKYLGFQNKFEASVILKDLRNLYSMI
jgi:hypothetical protein